MAPRKKIYKKVLLSGGAVSFKPMTNKELAGQGFFSSLGRTIRRGASGLARAGIRAGVGAARTALASDPRTAGIYNATRSLHGGRRKPGRPRTRRR